MKNRFALVHFGLFPLTKMVINPAVFTESRFSVHRPSRLPDYQTQYPHAAPCFLWTQTPHEASRWKSIGDLEKLLFAVLSERFWSHKSIGNSGILCVLRDFQCALWGQKIRSKPKRVVFRGALLYHRIAAKHRFPNSWKAAIQKGNAKPGKIRTDFPPAADSDDTRL